jgi:hypothetical protein
MGVSMRSEIFDIVKQLAVREARMERMETALKMWMKMKEEPDLNQRAQYRIEAVKLTKELI